MAEYTGRVIDGWSRSIAQLWGSGPKLTIVCGGCGKGYEKRVAPSHRPRVICPHCYEVNVLDVTIDRRN